MKKFLSFLMIAILAISLTACGKDDAVATVQGLHGICHSAFCEVDIDFGEDTLEQVIDKAVADDVKVSWELETGETETDNQVVLSLSTSESVIKLYFMTLPNEGRASWVYASTDETMLDGEGMKELTQMLFGSYL